MHDVQRPHLRQTAVYITRGHGKCRTGKALIEDAIAGEGEDAGLGFVKLRGYYCGGHMGTFYCLNKRSKPTKAYAAAVCATIDGCPKSLPAGVVPGAS